MKQRSLRPLAALTLALGLVMPSVVTAQRSGLTGLERRYHELLDRRDYAGAIAVACRPSTMTW